MAMKIENIDKLRIVNYPAPVLLKVAAPVETFDDQLAALVDRMFELMRLEKGVGLAAPQVGIGLRLFICNATGEPDDDTVIVNPRFVELEGAEEADEGCLSLPEVTVNVRRAKSVVLDAQDLQGNEARLTAEDLPARIWQHETDHLDGKLILDYMSPADEIANRRAIKQLKDDYRAAKAR
jgi:peptide deformylase